MNAPAARQGTMDMGRYEVLFRLASGGMAEVFVARQRGEGGFERVVAIKRMLAHLADDERFVAMFLDEARLAAYISSPHVVQTLDVDVDEQGSPFIVMDLVIGLTLAQTLRAASARKTFIPVSVAVELLAQAADGLHDAHQAMTPTGLALQIVHRDVSPQNTLIGVDGRVRIMDFGVARALARITKTSTGEFKGKISYFSPEQAEGKELDQRSDIFSHGIVAWETFVGARLFKSDQPLAVLDAIRSQRIPLVSELRPEVPEAVAKVVAKALERDVNLRYQTARDFSRDLRKAAEATLEDSPDPRMLGSYVREVSGSVLDQMSQRISDAFARNSTIDSEGRASMPQVGTKSKLRFVREQREIEDLSSEPPPPGMVESPNLSSVRGKNPLFEGGMPKTRLSLEGAPLNSDHPTMVGSAAGRKSQVGLYSDIEDSIPPPPTNSATNKVAIGLGVVTLLAVVGTGGYFMTRPDEVPVEPAAPVAPVAQPPQAAQPTAAAPQPVQQAVAPAPTEIAPAPPVVAPTAPIVPAPAASLNAQRARTTRNTSSAAPVAAPAAPQVITNTVTVVDPAEREARERAERERQRAEMERIAAEERARQLEQQLRNQPQQAPTKRSAIRDEF